MAHQCKRVDEPDNIMMNAVGNINLSAGTNISFAATKNINETAGYNKSSSVRMMINTYLEAIVL